MNNISTLKRISVVTILSLATTSCTPAIEPRDADLGKESSASEVQKALNDAFSNISIADAQINQYVTYEDNIRVELNEVMKSRLIKHKLIDIKEDDKTVRFIMFEDFERYDLGTGNIIDEKHSELVIPFQKALQTTMKPKNALSKELYINTADACDGHDVTDDDGLVYDCIKYFNLVSQRRQVTPPAAVKAKPNCGGLKDCLMNIHYLKYDQVKWRNGKSVSTINVNAEIALDVADLMYEFDDNGNIFNTPPVKSLCYKGNRTLDGRIYLISQCTVLRDFQ
ncbi:MAG: hypothetical protein KDD38_07840 [Bdellovibrionales bacterium]|nr:hypothetical protein [Bdellovibrionales bacterium]